MTVNADFSMYIHRIIIHLIENQEIHLFIIHSYKLRYNIQNQIHFFKVEMQN